VLTGGPRTATARQQTQRASMEWSQELLSRRAGAAAPPGRGRRGFTLDAVERVCDGHWVERERTLDLRGSLVDQSLVIAEERGSGMRSRNSDRA
jgi:predicted ATPase